MVRISPYNYFISDGEVIEGGPSAKGTGIKAEVQVLQFAGVPTTAYCLRGAGQFNDAMKEFKKEFPKAELSLVNAEDEHASGLMTIGGLATSNAWIKVTAPSGAVLVHPLMIRLRARTGKIGELRTELSQAGILADIL